MNFQRTKLAAPLRVICSAARMPASIMCQASSCGVRISTPSPWPTSMT
jgi:hypothetical protein